MNLTLPPWSDNVADQFFFIEALKTGLLNLNTQVVNTTKQLVTLTQGYEPSQLEWEAAWVAQTGLALPILPSAELIWIDTSYTPLRTGGVYRVAPTTGALINALPASSSGGMYSFLSTTIDSLSSRTDFFTTPNISIGTTVIDRASTLRLRFAGYISVTTAATPASQALGIDFFANGVKLSTRYLNLAAAVPYTFLPNATSYSNVEMVIPNFPAGTYTFAVGLGNHGTPTVSATFAINSPFVVSVEGYRQ